MIRRASVLLPALSLAALAPFVLAVPVAAQVGVPPAEYQNYVERFSANQIDNLVGPVALYPDALLAQVLVASTFPDQVEDAARYVRAYGTDGIDDQPWDISVRAVAHYPSALNTMADKADWMAALGTAYANQSSDVMASVQRMRTLAAQQGNLVSDDHQQVLVEDNNYVIAPAQARVIYVPVYDPVVIYTRPVFGLGLSSRFWSFGVGFPIGGWLSYDLDWGRRNVYYNGWNTSYIAYGGGWRMRSRPFIQITNVYVNPRYSNVYVNRNIGRRQIDYRNVDRYVGYHRDTRFDNRRNDPRDQRGRDGRDGARNDNGGNTIRTAQPRTSQPRATPDGYRNSPRPESRDVNRGAQQPDARGTNGNGADNRNGNRNGGDRAAPPTRNSPRPQVMAPQTRRAEPQQRASERMIPEVRRASPPPQAQPGNQSRQAQPQRQSESRQAQPRQAQPRQSSPREGQSREARGRVSPARETGKSKPPASGRAISRGQ